MCCRQSMMMALVVAQCPPDVANPGGHRPWVLINFYFVSGALAICNLQGRRGSRASPPPCPLDLVLSEIALYPPLHFTPLHSTPATQPLCSPHATCRLPLEHRSLCSSVKSLPDCCTLCWGYRRGYSIQQYWYYINPN